MVRDPGPRLRLERVRELAGELVEMTLAAAAGKVAVEALTIWFRQRLRTTE
jgi:hypothetical protein